MSFSPEFSPEQLQYYGPWVVMGVVLRYLFSRVTRLEKRIEAQEVRSGHLAVLLERVCAGYTDVRNELLKVVRILRKGGKVSDDHLDEIEKTPDIETLLKTPVQ